MPANYERVPRKRHISRAPKWEYAQGPERERPVKREPVRGGKRGRPQEQVFERPQERERVPKRRRPQERVSERTPERGRARTQERERVAGRERTQERGRVAKRARTPERESAPNRGRLQERKRVSERGRTQERERMSSRQPVQERPVQARKPRRKAASGRGRPESRKPSQNRRRAVRRRRPGGVLSFLTRAAVLLAILFALGKVGNRLVFQELQVNHPDQTPADEETGVTDTDKPKTPLFSAASDIITAIAPDKPDSERKDGFYTILMAGVDDHNGGSDTIILVGVDSKSHQIFGVSVPRDTKAVINGKSCKINAAYNIGKMERLAQTVSEQLSIPIDYTVEIDLNGFAALIDAVGGIDSDVPIDMDYEDPKQNLSIHVAKGFQHLDGETALKVVRFRHNSDGTGYPDQDLGRIRTQQNFLKTAAKSMLSLSNLTRINDLARIFQKYVKTELTLPNLAWLGKEVFYAGADGVQFATLPGTWKSPYIYTDAENALDLINAHLNPYKEDRTLEDLHFPS